MLRLNNRQERLFKIKEKKSHQKVHLAQLRSSAGGMAKIRPKNRSQIKANPWHIESREQWLRQQLTIKTLTALMISYRQSCHRMMMKLYQRG